jgi:excisionase family DNA binding protein
LSSFKQIKMNEKSNFTKWLSSEEVCHLLMISKRTLQTYRDNGSLPFAQIGRKIYYKSSDIDDYLDRHYIKANYQRGGAYGN